MINNMNSLAEEIYNVSPVFIQNIFCSLKGLNNNRQRYGKYFKEYSELLQKTKNYNLQQLKEYQDAELKKLIAYCYKYIPYYTELFDSLNINYSSIQVENLSCIPILTKDKIIEDTSKFISKEYKKSDLIKMHTSGTTGSGLKFYVTKEAWQREYAMVWSRRRYGSKIGERYLTFSGRSIVPNNTKNPPFYRNNYFGKQILFSQYHMNEENLLDYVKCLNKLEYKYIQGYPSTIYILADYIYQNKLALKKYPEYIYTSSETIFDWQRDIIEKVFQCPVFDSYGTSELTNIITQCEFKNYHLNYEYGISEFHTIDEQNGLERCELISTGLINYGFPLLRYKTNDYVLVDRNIKSCKCGRVGPVIKRIEGRMEDIIITPEGNKIGRLDHIFKDLVNIKESQIIQEDINNITIKLVKRTGFSNEDEKQLEKEFYNRISKKINLQIKYVDNIERTKSGKFKAVISKINNVKGDKE